MKYTPEEANKLITDLALTFTRDIVGRVMTAKISMGDARKELHAWWAGQDADLRVHWQEAEKILVRIAGIGEAFRQEFVSASLKDRQNV